MTQTSQAVAFEKYFIYEFYEKVQQKLNTSGFDSGSIALYQKVFQRLKNIGSDPMLPIEELAKLPSTSEFTIFLMDLNEYGSIVSAIDAPKMIETRSTEIMELLGLLTEEPGLMDSLASYTKHILVDAPENNIQGQIEPKVSPRVELETLRFEEALASELNRLSANLPEELQSFLLATLSQLSTNATLLDTLLPSEVTNIIILLGELQSEVAKNIYTKWKLIENNAQAIDADFLKDLKSVNYDLSHVNDSAQENVGEHIPQIKVPKKRMADAVSPDVKQKVRQYFQHEVSDRLKEIETRVELIERSEVVTERYKTFKMYFDELKNISIIHGYEGVQTVSAEFSTFLDQCVENEYVFTEESHSLLRACLSSFRKLVEVADYPEEKSCVGTFFDDLNAFNSSLAIIELIEEEIYFIAAEEIQSNFFTTLQEKLNAFPQFTSELFMMLEDDYHLIDAQKNIEVVRYLKDKPKEILEKLSEKIRPLFVRMMNDTDLNEVNAWIIQETEAKLKLSEKEKSALINEQKFSFEEIRERNGIYESILSKKLDDLTGAFEKFNGKTIIHLSNWIEVETRWLGYENIADFVNYYTLKVENVKDKIPEVLREIYEIKKSPLDYQFQVENFEQFVPDEEDELRHEIVQQEDDVVEMIDESMREVFIEEASSYIVELEEQLRQLRANQENKEALAKGENAAHTLKGAAKILQLEQIGNIASRIEQIFESANEFIDLPQIIEIENRLDTVKKLVGIYKPTGDHHEDEGHAQSEHDEEMLSIFREESDNEIESIESILDGLASSTNQKSDLDQLESNAHTLKSSAKILGFKEIGLLSEKLEGTTERLKNLDVPVNITVIDEIRFIVDLIKKLRQGEMITLNKIQIATQRLNDVITEHIPQYAKSERRLGEFEQLFIDETLEKVMRINEKIDHADPIEDLAVEFNNIKRSAALVGFRRIKNLATVTERLCEISVNKLDIYPICRSVTRELRDACERIVHGNYENIGKIDELISQVNEAILNTKKESLLDYSLEVDKLQTVINQTIDKIQHRADFYKRMKRLRDTLTTLGEKDESITAAVDDLMFISEQLNSEIRSNIRQIHDFSSTAKKVLFQYGEPEDIVKVELGDEVFGYQNKIVKQLFNIEESEITETLNYEEHSYAFTSLNDCVGRDVQFVQEDSVFGLLKKDDHVIISKEAPFESEEVQLIEYRGQALVEKIGLLPNNDIVFILN